MISNCLPDLEFFFFLNIFDAVLGVIIWKELCKIGGKIEIFAKTKMQDWYQLTQAKTLNLLFGQPKILPEFQKSKRLHLWFLLLSVFENIFDKKWCIWHASIFRIPLYTITYGWKIMGYNLGAIRTLKNQEKMLNSI